MYFYDIAKTQCLHYTGWSRGVDSFLENLLKVKIYIIRITLAAYIIIGGGVSEVTSWVVGGEAISSTSFPTHSHSPLLLLVVVRTAVFIFYIFILEVLLLFVPITYII